MIDAEKECLRIIIREELAPHFAELRRFMDRRLAEVSAEVHGATQLLGFSEANLSSQLGRLQEELGSVVGRPSEATRNSGLELEAVVQTTEAAANQIMEAAEAIGETLRAALPDQHALAAISAKIDAIFEACAFQDLTGQRVRRAIEHLQHMESTLSGILSQAPEPEARPLAAPEAPRDEQSQDAIAALFAA